LTPQTAALGFINTNGGCLQKRGLTARGILGQYIYVNPEKELIIVRLGKKQGGVHWMTMLPELAKGF
jgi:hypothetical protein